MSLPGPLIGTIRVVGMAVRMAGSYMIGDLVKKWWDWWQKRS